MHMQKSNTDFVNLKINEVNKYIIEKDKTAYIMDPVFKIVRNRVNAEFLKTLIRMNKNKSLIHKIIEFILKNQNKNGSWNEIHPKYSKPSALITSIIGEALILGFESFPDAKIKNSIYLAQKYVLSQEKNGLFIKSDGYTADHLNVDATCSAFLFCFGKKFYDNHCIDIATKTTRNIVNNQFKDGSFPYTTNKGNYTNNLNIPCIHYQGVTLYYISKIHEIIKEKWLKKSIIHGTEWLANVQKSDGKFDWSKSGLMFSYYLSGAYAFAFATFNYTSKWNKDYLKNAAKTLKILKKNSNGLILRWEKDSWLSFPFSIPITFNAAFLGDYNYNYKLFRLGYGFYRQIARRKYSEKVDDKLFKSLNKLLNLKVSTIESFSNYPDMFMTSEVLDCLSYSLNKNLNS